MPIPVDHVLARTLALLDPDQAGLAARSFRGTTEQAEIEGLVELLLDRESTATASAAALRALDHTDHPIVSDAVLRALGSAHPSIRILAMAEVTRRGLLGLAGRRLREMLRADPFWQVRRAAVSAIGSEVGESRWDVCFAATDPHWRARYALAELLERSGVDAATREAIGSRLAAVGPSPRVNRLRDFLAYRWNGVLPPDRPTDDPAAWCPFWDWDAAVLASNLDRLGRAGRRELLGPLSRLVTHPDERVRGWVVRALRDDGTPEHWADALARLGDPRDDTAPVIDQLVRGFELDRLEVVAKRILRSDSPAPAALADSPAPAALAWALGQVGKAFPADEVRDDLDRMARAGLSVPQRPTAAIDPPFPDGHPHARAAALTLDRAQELLANPTLETSWLVLTRAASLCKVPIWALAPEKEWKPPAEPKPPEPLVALPTVVPVRPRALGPGGPVVSPLGVSGHYGLPVEGFARAAEQGVNLFFWEPNYANLTRFMTRLGPADRSQLHLLAGTFEAEAQKIRRDAERALKNLRIDRLGVFLIFWTQSWGRITDEVRDVLERLKAEGKVQVCGLSTHDRGLAADAIREGWSPVMVRHSAAHRKAEAEVFPLAHARGTSILTFNNTCYGRLLDPGGDGGPAFRPSDCFRFTLNTPGVSACFTAPATLDQLDENLSALRDPHLSIETRDQLIRRGEWLYREDTVFRKTVRADV